MQFCSFVTEFYQAFTKYSLQCIKQIPYGPRNIESPTGFLQVYPNSIFPFLFRTSSFCRLPILFAVELSNNPPPPQDKHNFNKFGEAFRYDTFEFYRKFLLFSTKVFCKNFFSKGFHIFVHIGTFPQMYAQCQQELIILL